MKINRRLLLMTSLVANAITATTSTRPNVVVIVADDMGHHDLSSMGSHIQTPNIDRLTTEGVKLDNYYVQPVCSPTRGALMTGRYPFRLGLQHENLVGYRPAGLPLEEETMADLFRECGYKTSMIGKWQLGFFKESYLPWNRGFDEFFGQLLGGQDYYSRKKCLKLRNHGNLCGYDLRTHEGPVRDTSAKYQPFLYADKAKEKFMAHNKTQPLYMYLAFQSVHRPLQAPSMYTRLYDGQGLTGPQKIFAGMVTALDAAIGDVVDGLKESGLWNNTILFFSNDNGREGGGRHRGGKNDFFQGGISGTGFFSGPVIARSKQGTRLKHLTHISDVLPTVLAAGKCQNRPSLPIDGFNLWPFMNGAESEDVKKRREIPMQINPHLVLHGHDPRNFNTKWDTRMQGVYIKGDMKLIAGSYSILRRREHESRTVFLYNVTEDSQEIYDLSDQRRSLAESLMDKLADLLPEAKYPWHPAPDPKSDPDLNGGFWGPFQEDDLPSKNVTDEDYDTVYPDDEDEPFDQ